jgi:hypothetical protein
MEVLEILAPLLIHLKHCTACVSLQNLGVSHCNGHADHCGQTPSSCVQRALKHTAFDSALA